MPTVLKDLCAIPKGLVLVTGPTGSGKSTTLAAMIDSINKTRRAHLITIEDPIEFVHESQMCLVNQREIGGHTSSFSRALRAALREDPDIILVGEMRDRETISLALEAANTGHLVFATLHTNTAISAVDRIVDQFPLTSRLMSARCWPTCSVASWPRRCASASAVGASPRIEVLVVNFAIANLIREAKTVQIPNIMQAARGQGMTLLNDELMRLVEIKKIEFAEALARAVDKQDITRRFRSGLTVADDPQSTGNFRITQVTAGSPGAEAGLSRGDLIVEIAGKPAAQWSLEEVRQLFRSDGKHILGIEREWSPAQAADARAQARDLRTRAAPASRFSRRGFGGGAERRCLLVMGRTARPAARCVDASQSSRDASRLRPLEAALGRAVVAPDPAHAGVAATDGPLGVDARSEGDTFTLAKAGRHRRAGRGSLGAHGLGRASHDGSRPGFRSRLAWRAPSFRTSAAMRTRCLH